MYPLKPRKRLEMAHRPFSVWRIITRSKGVYIKLVAIRGPSASSSWKPVDQGSLLEAGLYLLLRSLVLVDLLERRLKLWRNCWNTAEHVLGGAGMWVASRWSVETKACRQGCSWRTGRKDWRWDRNFGYGGGLEHTLPIGPNWAVGLSQAREGYRTEFYIHLVPANA